MMKKKNGFTLIELLAVIVVLAIVTVLATSTILPYMGNAREDAFKVEAANAVNAADYVMNLYALGEFSFDSTGGKSSYNSETKKACITIEALIDAGAFDADKDAYKGRVIIDKSNNTYTLSLKKNDEFTLVNATGKSFSDAILSKADGWNAETYENCKNFDN